MDYVPERDEKSWILDWITSLEGTEKNTFCSFCVPAWGREMMEFSLFHVPERDVKTWILDWITSLKGT